MPSTRNDKKNWPTRGLVDAQALLTQLLAHHVGCVIQLLSWQSVQHKKNLAKLWHLTVCCTKNSFSLVNSKLAVKTVFQSLFFKSTHASNQFITGFFQL